MAILHLLCSWNLVSESSICHGPEGQDYYAITHLHPDQCQYHNQYMVSRYHDDSALADGGQQTWLWSCRGQRSNLSWYFINGLQCRWCLFTNGANCRLNATISYRFHQWIHRMMNLAHISLWSKLVPLRARKKQRTVLTFASLLLV